MRMATQQEGPKSCLFACHTASTAIPSGTVFLSVSTRERRSIAVFDDIGISEQTAQNRGQAGHPH